MHFPDLSGPSVEQQIEVSKANLAKPNYPYPNGRMSHDVENEYLTKLEADLAEHKINGRWSADGKFVGY